MKCRAAVLRGVGRDWEIREVDLDPPRSGEVLVRMAVAGICHSDDHLFTGERPLEDRWARLHQVGQMQHCLNSLPSKIARGH